jgi:hypothetical protein
MSLHLALEGLRTTERQPTPSASAGSAKATQFAFDVPSGFGQGNAVFGGLVVGALSRAMLEHVGDETRKLRSISAHLLGAPAVGATRITVRPLRVGRGTTVLAADLFAGDELMCHAVGVFGGERPFRDVFLDLQAPVLPPVAELPLSPVAPPLAPEFTQHFEFRVKHGLPFSGIAGETLGYVRPKPSATPRTPDLPTLIATSDAWWMSVMQVLPGPRPSATLAFTLELHDTDAWCRGPRDAWLIHRGNLVRLGEGYSTETRDLWTEDGKLLATNRQLAVVIK